MCGPTLKNLTRFCQKCEKFCSNGTRKWMGSFNPTNPWIRYLNSLNLLTVVAGSSTVAGVTVTRTRSVNTVVACAVTALAFWRCTETHSVQYTQQNINENISIIPSNFAQLMKASCQFYVFSFVGRHDRVE